MRPVRRRSIARRFLRFVRLFVVVAILVDVMFPVHALSAVARSARPHVTFVAEGAPTSDHQDDDCPGGCAACACLHLRCVPPSANAALELAAVPSDALPPPRVAHERIPPRRWGRLERPPRATAVS